MNTIREGLTALLRLLHALGAWSMGGLWLPLAAWTLATFAALALLRLWAPPPLVGYRARQALLFALPPGLGLAAATDWGLLPAAAAPTASLVPAPVAAAAPAAPPAAAPVLPAFTWTHALGALTLAAALLAAWRLARLGASAAGLAPFRRELSAEVPASARRAARRVARRLGLRRRFRLARAPAGTPPMTLGALCPTVALPPGLSGQEQRMALAHELVHLRRRDDYAAWIEALLGALFFIHPLCALLRRRIDARREEACDAAVLAGGCFSPRRYAQMLLDFTAPAPRPLALSFATPSSSLKPRLDAMKAAPAPAPRFAFALSTLLLAVPLLLMACADLSAPTEAGPAAEPSQANAAPDDALRQSIASVDVHKGDDESVLIIHVRPGTSQEVRDRLRQQVERNSEAVDRIVITEAPAGGNAEASSRETSHPEGGRLPVPTLDKDFSSFIQRVEIQKAGRRGRVHLTLQPGTPEAVREQIREQLPDAPDGPRFTVEIAEAPAPPAPRGNTPHGPQAGTPRLRIGIPDTTVDLSAVDEKPEIVGGPRALYENIEYPEAARSDSLEGTVYVQFVVSEEGAVREANVLRGPAAPLDRAALRAIRALEFRPARMDGEAVAVRLTQPVRFKL